MDSITNKLTQTTPVSLYPCTVLLGHNYVTHSYLLKGWDQPQCVACNIPLTVKHIMLDCVGFDLVRTDHFNVDRMKDLFEKMQPDSILAYLKEINLFVRF